MSNANASQKRIVSKSRFAANAGRQIALALFGVSLSGAGIVALLYCIIGIQLLTAHTKHWTEVCMMLFVSIGLIVFPLILVYFGVTAVKQSNQMDLGIPHTHANTAELPAPDSLVRPSQEPEQLQENVLLRASKETQDEREEQLLRASLGE